MRLFWSFIFSIFCISANAQFRASVEASGFNLVSDSTYSGVLKNWIDQADEGYLPNGVIVDSMYFVDAAYRIYIIRSKSNVTFSKLSITLEGLKNYGFRPTGRGQIYKEFPEGIIPITPDNHRGVSPILKSKIETGDFKVIADSLRLLLDNSIDSIKLENDSISVFYHRKEKGRIYAGSVTSTQVYSEFVTSSTFIDVPFDLPIVDVGSKLIVVRTGYSAANNYDYTIGLDGSNNRRRIFFLVDINNEFLTIKLTE